MEGLNDNAWSVAATESQVLPWIVPSVALILELPTPTPVASPVLVIVAMGVADELQVTDEVRF